MADGYVATQEYGFEEVWRLGRRRLRCLIPATEERADTEQRTPSMKRV
jgi:hypothetical protein